MKLGSRFALLAVTAVTLTGCETFSGFAAFTVPAKPDVQMPAERPIARLQPGDKAKIVVYGEDKLSGDFEVDSNGQIVLPLVGSIRASGMSKRELESALVSRLKAGQILLKPVVTVDIAIHRPFYILGEVEKPGEYVFRNGLNAMSAVAVAGGYTYRASKSRIMIQRAGQKTFAEYQLSPDIPIFPGDLISVPERYF